MRLVEVHDKINSSSEHVQLYLLYHKLPATDFQCVPYLVNILEYSPYKSKQSGKLEFFAPLFASFGLLENASYQHPL